MVYLVGAGPGDSGLITQKGLECIKKADVIIYDHLANPTLLSYAKNDCKLIYAGKIAGNHHMVQEEINKTLVEHSRFGNVVRLKGGDPFIFGRGGEEALELSKMDIPFEIVPGVTMKLYPVFLLVTVPPNIAVFQSLTAELQLRFTL